MNCDAIRDLLSAYLDSEANAAERRTVEEHLAACAGCRAELEGLRRAVERVKALPKLTAPPELARRVADALPTAAAGTETSARPSPATPGMWAPMPDRKKILPFPRFLVPFAAAACFILAVGVALYVERGGGRQAAAPESEWAGRPSAPGADGREGQALASRDDRLEDKAAAGTRRHEMAKKDADGAPSERAAGSAKDGPSPAKDGNGDYAYAKKRAPAASVPASPAGPTPATLAAAPPPAAVLPPAEPALPAVTQAPAPVAPPPPAPDLAQVPARDPASDPFRQRLTPKKELKASESALAPAARPAPGAAAGQAGPPRAAEPPADATAAADMIEEPHVVLAIHGGDPAKQAAMLDALAYAPPPADEKSLTMTKGGDGRPREKARSLEGLARVRGEAVQRAAKEGRAVELAYDLAPQDAARFLRGLAGREELRVSVERTLIGSPEGGEADAPLVDALAKLQAREANLQFADAGALEEARQAPAEQHVEKSVRRKAEKPAKAPPAAPAPSAAKASESAPSFGASRTGAQAKPAYAASSPRRVRIVVRLIQE